MKYCAGIDVGGTTVKMGLFQVDGTLVEKWEIPTRKEDSGSHILEDIAESIKKKLKERKLTLADLEGAGIGVPGPVKSDGSNEVCVNLGWKDRNPTKELSALLDGLKVKTGNDANVAALGEMWQGGGKGYNSIVMFTLGTGVGGGVVLDGKIVDGSHGAGGEVGHFTVNYEETDQCNCGGHGCLEQYASATGVVRVTRQKLENTSKASALRGREHISAKTVFDAAKAGDELALEVVDTLGMYLGRVMATVSMTVDPEAYVIGGGVSKAGQILIDAIQKHYESNVTLIKEKAKLVLATLGNDAGICGAAKMVL